MSFFIVCVINEFLLVSRQTRVFRFPQKPEVPDRILMRNFTAPVSTRFDYVTDLPPVAASNEIASRI
jgi:hypothetical protein